jgi:hypothetical protein
MKMDKVAGSGYDEFYTPEYAVKPIMKYIKPKSTIWCPFDTDKSHFVKMLRVEGHNVISSHLEEGVDFFKHEEECDYIISNPPYSLKNEIFERLFQLGKPFAMLVGVVGVFESQRRFEMFRDNDFEVMYMNRRVSYFKNYEDQKPDVNPPFSSVYICSGILPKQVIFEEIDKSYNIKNIPDVKVEEQKETNICELCGADYIGMTYEQHEVRPFHQGSI